MDDDDDDEWIHCQENLWPMCALEARENATVRCKSTGKQTSLAPLLTELHGFLTCHLLFWNQTEIQSCVYYSKEIIVNMYFDVEKTPDI